MGKIRGTKAGDVVLHVAKETKAVRPFVVAAVLRGVKMDKANYNSFLDFQDKIGEGCFLLGWRPQCEVRLTETRCSVEEA